MPIRFAKVPGFPYLISTEGDVWRPAREHTTYGGARRHTYRGRFVKPTDFSKYGGRKRICVQLYAGPKSKMRSVGAWMLEAFVGPPPTPRHVCRHLDGDYRNNTIDNLAWGTHSDNMQDSLRHGTFAPKRDGRNPETVVRGELVNTAKLDADRVRAMRALRAAGWTYKEIGDLFGVTVNTVRNAVLGLSWSHVK